MVDPDGELWERFDVGRRHTYLLITSDNEVERIDFRDLESRLSTLS